MATEPERRIEQLLRAYAQKRREEAPQGFELHPVNRRLLQDEVARLRNQTSSGISWLDILARFWRQIALASSILIALGVVLWATNPWQSRTQQLALRSANDALDRKQANEPAPARALEKTPALDTAAKAKGTPTELAKALPLKEAPAPNKAAAAPEVKSRISGEITRESERLNARFGGPGTAPKTDSPTSAGASAEGNIAAPAPPPPGQLRSFGMQLAESAPGEVTRSSSDALKLPAAPSARPAPSTAPIGAMSGGYGGMGAAGNRVSKPVVGAELPDGMTRKSQVSTTQPADQKQVEETLNSLLSKRSAQSTSPASSLAFGHAMETKTGATSAPENLARARGIAAPSSPQATAADLAQKDISAAPLNREQFASVPATENYGRQTERVPSVLDSFVLERTGDRVKIIDADGSVYEGRFIATTALNGIARDELANDKTDSVALNTNTRQRLDRFLGDRSLTAPLTFRASGLNKTLQQKIEITATINAPVSTPTNGTANSTLGLAMRSMRRGAARGGRPSVGAPAPAVQSAPKSEATPAAAPPSNAVCIEGIARIGNTDVPLKAVRISR